MDTDDRLEETRPTGHGRARGLVSSRKSGSRVEARRLIPPAALRDIVECFWVGRWDLRGQAPHESRLLGDPSVHLVFERGTDVPPVPAERVVGVWTKLWTRTLAGEGRVRGIKLHPGAARALITTEVHVLSNRMPPLRKVFGNEVDTFADAVAELEHDDQAFAAISPWLLARRDRVADPQASLAIALARRIREDPEIRSVDRLAEVGGMGVRPLQRLFRTHVGASPKWVIRRARLQEAALRMEQGAFPTLAGLAAELGYADHAHLTRDFKLATGKTPSQFMDELWR